MRVLLFGILADAAGKTEVESNASDIVSLRRNLMDDFPSLSQYTFQFAVNKEKVNDNVSLNDHDEVALLPPFAGG